MSDLESTRASWDVATRNHNSHKGDQAAFLREGGDTLFPEELELLGPLNRKRLVHLQCNSGQDTLCLARRGAVVTGVDFSSEAVRFARTLSSTCGIEARFIESEVLKWLHETDERYDLAFSSYGAVGWLPDLTAWAEGIHRVLNPGGRFIYVEFHPLVWSIGPDLKLSGDDYFSIKPFRAPVGDYVAESETGLLAVSYGEVNPNTIPATSWQYGLASIVESLTTAGFLVERFREYPFANGCKVNKTLVAQDGRRWVWPEGAARVPLMFGLSVLKA